MIRKIQIFLLSTACLALSGGAAEPDSMRNRALQEYARAVRIADPARRAAALLKVLELDPSDRASCRMLLIMGKKDPAAVPAITAGLVRAAEQHPEAPELNLAAFLAEAGTSPAGAARAAGRVAKVIDAIPEPEKLASEARAAYLKLLGLHVVKLQKDGRYDTADRLLTDLLTRMPETALLLEMQSVTRSRAIWQAPDTRRLLGLRQSERAEWREKCQESLAGLRRLDADLFRLKDFEQRADLYIRLRSFDDALRIADLAVKRLPEERGAEYLRITTRMRTRHYPEAYAAAQALFLRQSGEPMALRLLADTAMRCGAYGSAEIAGKKLEEVQAPDESGCFFTVIALALQKKYPEAAKKIRSIRDRELRMALEIMLQNRARTSHAEILKRLKKLEANPNYKGGDAVYAQMLSIAEQTRDAALLEYCWKKLAAMDALKDPENANNVGYTAAVMGVRLEDARKLVESAVAAQPENGAYLDSMAWVCYRLGRNEEAWEYIRRALEVPDDQFTLGVVLDHAGDIALRLGKTEQALAYYRQALGDYLTLELDQNAVKAKIEKLEKKLNGGTEK